MKIVLDTNVLISALIHDGKPRLLLSEILRRQELVISREILKEVAVVTEEGGSRGMSAGVTLPVS
jgi:putative PIN family toxin of toxin-antitoxin system